ncbi:MAG: FHA domain-containing protein [Polyangiaceae bacterium]|nr:FHA domain-containing protein [Polyangiaceae bacterium]
MARFRLRFLLQEFDLPPGETLLGRSPDCHVTIEDPLVSRHHARVLITDDEATVEDLGSRNGVRVNGALAKGATRLAHNDRVRIGTQELVFCKLADGADLPSKRTGFLRHCGRCQTPFPEEMISCPSCGWGDDDEATPNGSTGDGRSSWTFQLLLEVVEKALSLGRDAEADRMMARAADHVNERTAAGSPPERPRFDSLAMASARLAVRQQGSRWIAWSLGIYEQLLWAPPAALVDHVEQLPAASREELAPAGERLALALAPRAAGLTDDERAALARLQTTLGSTVRA